MVLEPLEPDEIDIGGDDLGTLALGHAAFAQAEGDVLGDRQPRKQRVGLEDHAAIRPRPGDCLAVEQHAAFTRCFQPGDNAQQRRLSAAGRPGY
jgi:hypothetical protein